MAHVGALASELMLLFFATVAAANTFRNCVAKTDAIYRFPDTPLSHINYFLRFDQTYQSLSKRGCPAHGDDGDLCPEKPAVGSGLEQLFPNYFLALTDNGPNEACDALYAIDPSKYAAAKGKTGKAFMVPRFAPAIVHFQIDRSVDAITRPGSVALRGRDGKPISGLPNTPADDTPYGPDCAGPPLPYDPSGLDTEDIARIPRTEYVAIIDEYAPSVVIASYKTGTIIARHVPKSLKTALSRARYPIVGDIPDVYANRRKNRGFEGVVVDADSKYVIAILQSPMLGEDEDSTKNNAIIRCAYFAMSVSKSGVPSLTYTKSFIVEASSPSAYIDESNTPKDMKYSAAQYVSKGKFIALERANSQVKLFLIDWTKATNVDETVYANDLKLEKKTNGVYLSRQFGVRPASKVLVWDSAPGVGGTADFSGSFKMEGFAIDKVDDSKLWIIDDNDFGLGNRENSALHKISLGRSPAGATVCEMPAHPPAPKMNLNPTKTLRLKNSQTYHVSSTVDGGAAENLDVDENKGRVYVANGETNAVDVYDANTSPVTPVRSFKADVPFNPTSISVCKKNGYVAVGLDAGPPKPGRIDIRDREMRLLHSISRKACVEVDSVAWTPDCKFLVGACEGFGADVPGAVMILDFGGPANRAYRGAKVATFEAFDTLAGVLSENGVRLIESRKPSLDLEPEYVATDGMHAYVTLQENNAIAVVDLFEGVVAELKPIGFIDRMRPGFALDASDKDGRINIRNYPFLYGLPQPDTISMYEADDGKPYLVFVNEGDAKDSEEARGKDVTDPTELARKAVPGLERLLNDDRKLGRIKFSSVMGYNASTNTQHKLFHFGSRSFSIMSLDGSIVFDSGEWFERIMQRHFPKIFNTNGLDDDDLSLSAEDLFDKRSDDKGVEPESLSIMTGPDGHEYAFIGFERANVIVVFDVSNPREPRFTYATRNNPTSLGVDELFAGRKQGDMDPEGLFASRKLGKLFVSGSVSNTVTSHDIEIQ